jgi:hypothetical protein
VLLAVAGPLDSVNTITMAVQAVCRVAPVCCDLRLAVVRTLVTLADTHRALLPDPATVPHLAEAVQQPQALAKQLKVAELKQLLRALGCKVTGIRAELVDRVLSALRLARAGDDAPPPSLLLKAANERSAK